MLVRLAQQQALLLVRRTHSELGLRRRQALATKYARYAHSEGAAVCGSFHGGESNGRITCLASSALVLCRKLRPVCPM
jgi:hypothetical protein